MFSAVNPDALAVIEDCAADNPFYAEPKALIASAAPTLNTPVKVVDAK